MSDKSITFVIPRLPPSVNTLYEPKFLGSRMVGMKLKDTARQWQNFANAYVPRFEIDAESTVRIDCEFSYDWDKRRFDCANLVKLVIDTVAYRLCFNDRIVRHGSWFSTNSEKEYVQVTLTEIKSHE